MNRIEPANVDVFAFIRVADDAAFGEFVSSCSAHRLSLRQDLSQDYEWLKERYFPFSLDAIRFHGLSTFIYREAAHRGLHMPPERVDKLSRAVGQHYARIVREVCGDRAERFAKLATRASSLPAKELYLVRGRFRSRIAGESGDTDYLKRVAVPLLERLGLPTSGVDIIPALAQSTSDKRSSATYHVEPSHTIADRLAWLAAYEGVRVTRLDIAYTVMYACDELADAMAEIWVGNHQEVTA